MNVKQHRDYRGQLIGSPSISAALAPMSFIRAIP
jgi:hypothetical protein